MTTLKPKPMANPIAAPTCSGSLCAVGITFAVAITVEMKNRAAIAKPRKEGTSNITPITRTTALNRATLVATIEDGDLQALQSSCMRLSKKDVGVGESERSLLFLLRCEQVLILQIRFAS